MISNQVVGPRIAAQQFQRFSPFKEFVNDTFPWLEFDAGHRVDFRAHAMGYVGRERMALELETQSIRVARQRRRAEADQSGFIKVIWQLSGRSTIRQCGREAALSPGDASVSDTSRAYQFRLSDDARFALLLLPYESCPGWHQFAERLCATRLRDRMTAQAAHSALSALMRASGLDDIEAANDVLLSVQSMMTASLRRMASARGAHSSDGADVLGRVRTHILSNLHDPALGPRELAAAVDLSRRGLYSALESHGLTPARLITDTRLAQCKRALADHRRHRQTITQIAFEFGFSDAAQFSHVFKARNGMAPSEWRMRALQDPDFDRLATGAGSRRMRPRPPGRAREDAGARSGARLLTGREREVLARLVEGLSNTAISATLCVSENTVKFHLKNIYRKLGVRGRLPAIRAAEALRLAESSEA